MTIGTILLVGFTAAQSPVQSTGPSPEASACAQAMVEAVIDGAAASEICRGEEAARLANAASNDNAERMRQLEAAVAYYRRAVLLASKVTIKLLALNALVNAYETPRLYDLQQMEAALREIVSLSPDDLVPVFRLARVQEDQGLIDASEDTLVDARRLHPDEVEPLRVLAQFYARRVTALHKMELQKEPEVASTPGEPDENGVYRIGGAVKAPSRLDIARYPPDASAAGIRGTVIAEVVVDASGNVSDAKLVQSIPLLDEAALQAVRNWRYAPTVVDGQPVPVRMTVTVNFTLPPTTPSPAAPVPPLPPRR